ncbi:OmpA family protein [Shewanella canadensis]|uniref:OmpA family protein n=1 Tax=Shewanella canadensis TaxID=271096 RepID=A0A431WQP3_9GAMM|nr:OmpA family protein [Shewanella canadensis]RTR37499.1 OmpA family protein [Shewanella canadensis]
MKQLMLSFLCIAGMTLSFSAFSLSDSDQDGVPDMKDACPDTRPGARVDAAGCEKKTEFESICLSTTAGEVYPPSCSELSELPLNFEFAKAEVLFSQWKTLARLKQFLQRYDVNLCLLGYTDAMGSLDLNQKLSAQRATAVKQILVEDYGFSASRFIVKGMGSESPVASNEKPEGRASNRRVEFVVDLNR